MPAFRDVPASPIGSHAPSHLATQAAAVAAAEAIAATAAADVAAEAAVTAQAAVDVALAAAQAAAAKATEVAAEAVLAAAAAAVEAAGHRTPAEQLAHVDDSVTAAAKVALCVRAVAAAASTAALEAAAVVAEQSASDVAATAAAVAFASSHPALVGQTPADFRTAERTPAGQLSLADTPPAPAPELDRGQRRLADELRRGIATEQLRLHYQPIMHLASDLPVGVEALVRWQHPVRGLLAPDAFIDLADQTELIRPLGVWVLHEACRMAVSLQDRPGAPMTVAVNLSGRQLSDRGLVATVTAALSAAGCSAERLVFEVTETALVTDMAAAVDSLRELQGLGARVALDDFGTGFAPLMYLKQLAADDLKIDRSFVRGLGADSYDTAIVTSLIALAHNLNVRCVAEGVETREQLSLLERLGCDFAQGFLFSRPVDAASLGDWLDRRLPTAVPDPPPALPEMSQAALILSMHQDGASLLTIAAWLNARGSRTARSRRWSAKSVAETLGGAPA